MSTCVPYGLGRLTACFGLALVLVMALSGCAARPPAVATPSEPTPASSAIGVAADRTTDPAPATTAPAAPPKPYDELWLDDMIAQHMGATRAASMMIGDARHSELGGFTRQSLERDQRRLSIMQAWRSQWFGRAPGSEATQPGLVTLMGRLTRGDDTLASDRSAAGSPGRTTAGGASRADRDLTFLRVLVPFNQLAIHMAEEALLHAQREELKWLAREIIDDRSAEVATMRDYLRDWYGETPGTTDVKQEAERMRVTAEQLARRNGAPSP